MARGFVVGLMSSIAGVAVACGSDSKMDSPDSAEGGSGGHAGSTFLDSRASGGTWSGGALSTGGFNASAGASSMGGSSGSAGTFSTGGSDASAGASSTGGSDASAGTSSTGGFSASAGTSSTGGFSASVGTSSTGGSDASAGTSSTGGQGAGIDSSGVWYGYLERLLGFATVRVTSSLGIGDCSIAFDGLDDSSDAALVRYEGACVPEEAGWSFTLKRLSIDAGYGMSSMTAADDGYADARSRYWGDNDLKTITVSAESDGTRTIGISLSGALLPALSRRSPRDASYSDKRGTYPEVIYLGLNNHGRPQSPSLSLEAMGLGFSGTITSVMVTIRGPGDAKYENIELSYDAEEQDYGRSYALPSYPVEGLWFIAEAEVTTDKGSSTTLTRATAYDDFVQSIHTSNHNDLSGPLDSAFYRWLAQDYVPPLNASKWLYVEAYPNGSSIARVDPAMYAYRQDSTSRWFAANDDGGTSLMPALALSVASGERIYIEIKDIYRNGGAYSAYASLSDAERSTTSTVALDSYEPDDEVAAAKPLQLDTFQHRLFQVNGESDWLTLDIP